MKAPIEVVDPVRFVQATRDSGYRNITSALSELIDNSIQANASHIRIIIDDGKATQEKPYIAVLDNGCGMSPQHLSSALQFGGSNRFNDRNGMGRFGMGLPNSSLSQARHVDVYTWRRPNSVWHTYIDLDELLSMPHSYLAPPKRKNLPIAFRHQIGSTGTVVVWRELDRGQPSNWKSLVTRLERRLGQVFRFFLWEGRKVTINDKPVMPYDPLFLATETRTPHVRAQQYGQTLEFPIDQGSDQHSIVEVRFSELSVCEHGPESNHEKRVAGITNGAGISVVRAGREIDYGWFLMDKRRENYDDWWRCEIRFSPDADELFGVTHIKQGIRPSEKLCSIMTGEISNIARSLNRRVRLAHVDLAVQQTQRAAQTIAAQKDVLLRPLPIILGATSTTTTNDGIRQYRLLTEKIDDRVFSQTYIDNSQVTVILNTMHEFFLNIYRPLVDTSGTQSQQYRKQIELLLFALGRSLHLERTEQEQAAVNDFMTEWSRAIAIFCGGTV